jgi:hypothetical protein
VNGHFALACDCHIAPSAWTRSGIDGDSHHAFAAVRQICLARGVDLLLGGDVFDVLAPSNADRKFLRHEFDHFERAGRNVYYIQGQHELDRKVTAIESLHDHPVSIDGRTVEVGPYGIYGRDWQPAARIPDLIAGVPTAADIILGHQTCEEHMGSGRHVECELRLVDLPHVHAALFGDYHYEQRTELIRPDGSRLWAYSTGSLCMQSIDEPESKSILVFGDDLGAPERVPLPGRFCDRLVISTPDDLEDLIARGLSELADLAADHARKWELPEPLLRGLLQVTYPEDLPGAYTRLLAACEGRFHFFPKPVHEELADDPAEAAMLAAVAAGGMLAAMEQMVPAGRLRDDSVRLYKAPDRIAALEELIGDFG